MNWQQVLWTRIQSLGFVIFALIVAGGVGLLFLPLMHQRMAMQQEIRLLDREVARQESLEKQQRQELDALKTDPFFVERAARDKLNLARASETIFRFDLTAPAAPPKAGTSIGTRAPGAKTKSSTP